MTSKIILVLGMHRSGTSALCGVINRMGAYIGGNLMAPSKDNEKGYYENVDICHVNEYILSKLNSSWYDTEKLVINNNNYELHILLEYVIKSTFGTNKIIAIKDPRICLLLSLYKDVLTAMGYEIHTIKTYRKKRAIAKSLMERKEPKEFTLKQYKMLIDKYNSFISKEKCPIVSYDDLLNKTEKKILYIKKNFDFLNYNDEAVESIKTFLDKSLKHH